MKHMKLDYRNLYFVTNIAMCSLDIQTFSPILNNYDKTVQLSEADASGNTAVFVDVKNLNNYKIYFFLKICNSRRFRWLFTVFLSKAP